ncbi:hypothetical protein [Flammeovirga sp. OC4]|uniref:hypothetical protein n=1 Tax=Flammeovirga sp. OC4 TaxID=1382345 RepID=UPI0005C5234B|nr:hypothetical protein [Flammeovirga sp. OC4]
MKEVNYFTIVYTPLGHIIGNKVNSGVYQMLAIIIMQKTIQTLIFLLISIQAFSQIEKHPFGSITDRYILTLKGYFDDCGEFGGHEEVIELFREDQKFKTKITIYSKSCDENNYPKPKVITSKTYIVSKNKTRYFKRYLKKLMKKSLEFDIPFHAGRKYSARLGFRDSNINDNFERINLSYDDSYNTWTEFQKLKNKFEK